MLDFFGTGYDVAERLGLLPDLAAVHRAINILSFLDSRGREKFALSYSAMRKIFYNRHFNFLRGDLEHVLYSKVKDRAQFRFSTTVTSFVQDSSGVTAALSDGSEFRADVIVGADGFHSGIRALLLGEESRFTRFLGYNTAAFMLSGLPSDLSADSFSMIAAPSRQVALYPTGDGKLATFFVYRAEKPPRHLHGPEALLELRSAFSHMGWIVPDLFNQVEPGSLFFDQVAQVELPHWSNGRVILLGDACYAVSLIAGQGASLAMAGAYLLAQKLHSFSGDVASASAFYENRLRRPIEKKQLAARKFAGWFVPASSDRLFLRDLIMRFSRYALFRPVLRRSFSSESIFQG
jgi:2-polyprenyl-6-methoxyphenol hydroxylase-like FAD-dependent oxidoreductase